MRLEDAALERLREAVRAPDLSGTPYRLVGPIGSGGMGAVFEVDDGRLGRHVALKVVDVPLDGEGPAEALLHEARVLAGLEHPGLVPVHDAGRLADGRAFYVMKLVRGERLDAHLARVPLLPERLRLFLRVCEPVAFAHAHGILHGDLKPSNVMVGPFGEVLVLDWGLARALAPKEGEATAQLAMGTPGFMAPEQASGRNADARADVFGLGAVLDAALRVAPASPRSKALAAILARATAEERNSRYPDVASLAADVARLLDGERVEAHAEGPAERAVRLLRRHRVAVALVLAYLAVRGLFIFLRS
ncbi:MAG: serine/threonine protein kinase [Thermoanaerobaculia bacterium]|nr:serine/threonine protein kinase [Thermoanaerobaculia bacterium]